MIGTLLGMYWLALAVPGASVSWFQGDRPVEARDVVQQLIACDVVMVGEQHDDAPSHRTELALLKALDEATDRPVVLSLEMFESDVQRVVMAYVSGEITEAAFLEQSRPWPNYAADYRPLIEYARANGLGVLAANVPRRIAAAVAKDGLKAIDDLPVADQAYVAKPQDCPKGRPWERFQAVMQRHPHGDPWRQYEAQCVKDATMARSIVHLFEVRHRGTLVVHVQGAFHSDERWGVPWQLKATRPDLQQAVVTLVPAKAEDRPLPEQYARMADFVGLVAPQ